MIRIGVLGDLHYPRESQLFYELLRILKRYDFDFLFLCGDTVNYANMFYLEKLVKKIVDRGRVRIVGVMGNHDFWLPESLRRRGFTSLDIIPMYSRVLRIYGGFLLWDSIYETEEFVVVGVPGWYDFSFAPKNLNFTRDDYLRGWFFGFQWNDMLYTKFGFPPEKFVEINVERLRQQLDYATRLHKKIFVLLHFVPIRDFLRYSGDPEDVWNAYAGSQKLGEVILEYGDRISTVFFGHFTYKKLKAKKILRSGIEFINVDASQGIEAMEIIEV